MLRLFRGLGRGQAGRRLMGRRDFWSFSHEQSCLLFYFVYGYYTIPFFVKFNFLFLVNVPNFGGLSGSEDRGRGENSIQFINFGRMGDKTFEEWRQKMGGGGGRVGDNNILTFSSYCTR